MSAVRSATSWLFLLGLMVPGLILAAVHEDDSAYFQSVGDLESVPDGVVTALAEDQRGLLWIGTTRGLVRHDGYSFRRYVHKRADPGSLGGNLVRSLLLADDGQLWVGTDADGVSVLDMRSERFASLRHDPDSEQSLPAGAVMVIAQAPDRAIWLGTRGGGLARIDAEDGSIRRLRSGSAGELAPQIDYVHALLFDQQGMLWVGTRAGLYRLDPQAMEAGLQALELGTDGGPGAVYSLLQMAHGEIWAGTQAGHLLLIDPGTLAVRRPPISAGTAPGTLDTISAMVYLATDEVWLGRISGLEVRDPRSGVLQREIRHDPSRPSGLASNEIRALLESRSGLLWVGGFGGGVQRHDPGNRWVRVLRGEPGRGEAFAKPDVASLLQHSSGQVWVGTRGRGLAILDQQLRLIDGHPAEGEVGALGVGWITALAEASDRSVWLGTRDGLRHHTPGTQRFARYGSEAGLGNLSVRRLLIGGNGGLWIGTGDGLYYRDPEGTAIRRLYLADGSPLMGEINAFALDPEGAVWIAGFAGLFRADANAAQLFAVRGAEGAGLAHPSIVGLLLDSQQRLWVDTVEGLYLMHSDAGGEHRFQAISTRLGISGDYGANLLEDGEGRIWSHRYVYDPRDDSIYTLTRADGVDIGTGWFRSYTALADGRLLFGGSRGLLLVHPQRFRPWSYEPLVVLTDLRIGDQPQSPPASGESITLAPRQRAFSIEFAALDYSAPERLQYSYRLVGADDDWVAADAGRRVASYRNLAPGNYRLQVRGSNRTHAWSPHGLDIPVRVMPAWWQTRPFMLLALVAGVLLLSLAVRLRISLMRQRAEELESLVAQRTVELSEAKARAEQTLEDLQLTQNQLVEAEKMASLGSLVAGVAHEINTPIGIAVTAASHLKVTANETTARLEEGRLTKGDLRRWGDTLREGSDLILGSLQRAARLIRSFKQVAVDQSSEQAREFEMRSFLEEVRTALGPSYRGTPHRLDIECPAGIMMHTYPGALFQVLTNLINNALTHAFPEAHVGVMDIKVTRSDKGVCLSFSDNGVGMSAEIAAQAFEPFFTTRRSSGGSGLGLHLVYNLSTRLLGARIALHSTPGQGTRVTLDMPMVAPDTQAQLLRR